MDWINNVLTSAKSSSTIIWENLVKVLVISYQDTLKDLCCCQQIYILLRRDNTIDFHKIISNIPMTKQLPASKVLPHRSLSHFPMREQWLAPTAPSPPFHPHYQQDTSLHHLKSIFHSCVIVWALSNRKLWHLSLEWSEAPPFPPQPWLYPLASTQGG